MNGEQNQGGIGPLIGSIIIVLLLLMGGYYSWTSSIAPTVVLPPIPDNSDQPVPVISLPAKPSQASTEIKDIEADAMAVDTTSIDSGLENLDLLVK